MSSLDPKAALAELIAQIERNAYERGWQDAIQHLVSAASMAAGPKGTVTATPPLADQKAKATYGAVPKMTSAALHRAADMGVTPADVVAFARDRGEDIAESSARRELGQMVKRSIVTRQKGRYFLAQQRHAGGEGIGDGGASPAETVDHDEGGFHAAA